MLLSGPWRAIEADEALRRQFHRPDLDDSDWTGIPVPGHWRSHPAFSSSDGPLLYRHRFGHPAPPPGRRAWLTFEGVFYLGDVWIDGAYLGDTEGYFFPHSFEVTEALRQEGDHLLAVEVGCSPPADRKAKRSLTGVFQHWDCIDVDWNPGGLWRPVRLEETGPVRLVSLTAVCPEASAERALVDVTAVFDAVEPCSVAVSTILTRAGVGGAGAGASPGTGDGPPPPGSPLPAASREAEHPLAAGSNRVTWRLPVERPDLWWPAALGDQPLYDLSVAVAPLEDTGSPAAISDSRTVRMGLRQIRMRDFIATINGERLFLKGANYGPTDRAIGEVSAAQVEDDVRLARDAGLDLLRVHAHIGHPALYEAADRHGLLLWQDLPLQWGYSGVRRQAVRQAREAVTLLGHHPSIIVWCGHNEPFPLDLAPGAGPPGRRDTLQYLRGQALPSLNKTRLDRSIRRSLEKTDASRPVVTHAGVLPHPLWGTDSHLYFGWYHGETTELSRTLARFPVLARFLGEFGAQAVPANADFMDPASWPALDWNGLGRHHGLQHAVFERRVDPSAFSSFDDWRDATQHYQAELLRYHIETLRRLKYRPTGGFCQFLFADAQPAVSWSVLDHRRAPKEGYGAVRDACRPVIVVADWPAPSYAPGSRLSWELHVVSDLRQPVTGARLRADLTWPAGHRRWWFEGDVEADACRRIGRLELTVPEDADEGPLNLELLLRWTDAEGDHDVVSRYRSSINRTRPPV